MSIGLWLLRALGFLKPFMPYIAAVLILSGLLSAYGHREYARGSHSRDAEVAGLTAQRDGYKANQDKLTAALNRQNTAVDALKKEGDQRASDGKAALVDARKANQSLKEQADALRKSAGRKVDNTPCPVSDTLKQAGGI